MTTLVRRSFAPILVLAVGSAGTLGYGYWDYRESLAAYPEGGQSASWLYVGLVLLTPYVFLALIATQTRPAVTVAVLGVMLGLTAVFWQAVATDALGALVIVVTLPLQLVFAALAHLNRLRLVLLGAGALVGAVLVVQGLS